MPWSTVLAAPYNSYTSTVFAIGPSGERKRFEGVYGYEWGIEEPKTIPTLAAGSLTGLTGAYNAVYTYSRKERQVVVCESNPSSPAAAAVSLSNQSLSITPEEPEDSQINCIRFYRTTSDGESYYYSGEINYCQLGWGACYDWEADAAYFSGLAWRFTIENEDSNMEAVYTWELIYNKYTLEDEQNRITGIADNDVVFDDDHTDSELGTLVEYSHDRPPSGASFVMGPTTNGTLFILKQHQAYYCKPQQPEYWPSTYYVDVSSVQYPLVCGVFYDTRPYLFDARNIYYLSGTQFADLPNMTTYRPLPQESKTGAVNAKSVVPVLGLGIFHAAPDGIYRFMPGDSNGLDEKITDIVDPIFLGESVAGIPAVASLTNCWMIWFNNKLYFGYVSGSDDYPRSVMVFDFTRKKVCYYSYGQEFSAVCNDQYYGRFLAISSGGNLTEIENQSSTSDSGTEIDWEIETKQFILQTRKHYPRWNKYDVDASDSVSAQANSYLNDEVLKTHTLTGSRDSRRRLLPIANGNRFSVRLSGSGPITIYAVESE